MKDYHVASVIGLVLLAIGLPCLYFMDKGAVIAAAGGGLTANGLLALRAAFNVSRVHMEGNP